MLQEIAGDTMAQLASAPAARRQQQPQQQVEEADEDANAEDEDLRARLAAVRG